MVPRTIRWIPGVLAIATGCLLAACEESRDVQPREAINDNQQLMISDPRQAGSRGFVVLPPTVAAPDQPGEIQSGLPITLRIDEMADSRVRRTLGTFTAASGPRGERLRLHLPDQAGNVDDDPQGYYYARWHTDDAALTPSARYRVRVLVPAKGGNTRELGFADVDVVTTTREFKRVEASRFTALLNRRTLLIKFRVGWPSVDRDHDGIFDWRDNCPELANPDQRDSLGNGIGDACRCEHVTCRRRDACHLDGHCQPETGTCTELDRPDGAPCPAAHADGVCLAGRCQVAACHPHHADCNGNPYDGCETSLATPENCGGCGLVCPHTPDGLVVCRHGQCKPHCGRGVDDCDGDGSNGCETDLGNDPVNCGACGKTCLSGQACVRGSCSGRLCQESWADCDGDNTNGCETNTLEDAANCAACSHRCDQSMNATAACSAGTCVVAACNAGFSDCNGVAEDGCEVNLSDDPAHCGACGSVCAPLNGTGTCSAGTCQLIQCLPGYADCDGLVQSGCETALSSDAENCGSCANTCAVINDTPLCVAGTCEVGACASGFADCNGLVADGCETTLTSDVHHCGACGNECSTAPNATATCVSGSCGQSCAPGYADCDGDPANGCERDVAGNCGVCGTQCALPHARGECVDGTCSFSVCDEGFADCDGAASNGCEVDLRADRSNCGQCGTACQGQPIGMTGCVDGTCAIVDSCWPLNLGNCNGRLEDGCETYLDWDNENCGACGNKCVSSQTIARQCLFGTCDTTEVCAASQANCDGEGFNGCETDIYNSNENCGGCGIRCETIQGKECNQGICDCPGRMRLCFDTCVDVMSNPATCGGCWIHCDPGEECQGGNCVCPTLQVCGGGAICCPSGYLCIDGTCA